MVVIVRRCRVLVTVLTAGLLAAGCATGPIVSSAPPAAIVGRAACSIPTRFQGVEVERLPVKDKVVALTFDAGANADGLPAILDVLSERHVRATFFLTGQFVQTYPVRSQRIARSYLVGNHTMTHADLTTLSDTGIVRQIRQAEGVIRQTTGQDPRRFFRFPLGARTQHTIAVVDRLCYVPFRWTVDTLGWTGTDEGGMTAGKVVDRVMAGARPGEVVLMHVGSNPDDHSTLDADALPRVIHLLRERGYSFVTLARVIDPAP
jgi:peptidoglycan/xylan/chitin deacetylase (PgdA/CDA1 family)